MPATKTTPRAPRLRRGDDGPREPAQRAPGLRACRRGSQFLKQLLQRNAARKARVWAW